MAAIPLRGQRMLPFHQGAEFEEGPVTFTIAAGLTDPNNWDVFKLVIHPKTGTDLVSDPYDAVVQPVITGSGPWTVVAWFPIDGSASAGLAAKQHEFRYIIESDGYRFVLVEGLVEVLPMHQEEWS